MLRALLLVLLPLSVSAQPFNDGASSALEHLCSLGLAGDIAEDLTWTWVGYQGAPKSGDVYYVHIRVGALGCSGAWVVPELKLPRKTSLAIDAAHPVRCFVAQSATSPDVPLTDGSCPAAPSIGLFPSSSSSFPNPSGSGFSNDFYRLSPTTQPYWPLPLGRLLTIAVPVRTTLTSADSPLSGFASNDYLLGAVDVLDNNPGGPTHQWDGHPAGYAGNTIPSRGPWQGVFLSLGPSLVTRLVYPEPSTRNITETAASNHVYVYNAECVNPQQLGFELWYPDGGDPPGATPDPSGTGCNALDGGGSECFFRWTGLTAATGYIWRASFLAGSTTGCMAGTQVDPAWKSFVTASPPQPTKYSLLTTVDGPGTVSLAPAGGSYAAGTQVTVTAAPTGTNVFATWLVDGAAMAGPNPLTLTLNADHAVVARFGPAGTGGGAGGGSGGGTSGTGGGTSGTGGGTSGTGGGEEPVKKGCAVTGDATLLLGALALLLSPGRPSARARSRRGPRRC